MTQVYTGARGQPPPFFVYVKEASINAFVKLHYHPSCYRILSAMSASPKGNGESSSFGPSQYGMLDSRADHGMADTNYGNSNTNVGNVSNSNNTTVNIGIEDESLRIQEWLSPLEPYKRHQEVRNRRLEGVGEWVLQRSEFESWRKCQDGSVNRILLCYGAQGIGKTYIRYKRILP